MLKVDGGSSTIQRQSETVTKPTVKPTKTNTNSNQESNASVYANRNQNTQQASLLRFKLNAQVSTTAAQTTPTLTQQEAEERADQIIADNGGKGNLNTEGVGNDLAEIARQNPADAWAITQAMLGSEIDQDGEGKIKEDDKDEIAQSFTEALQDTEIATLARDENGRNLLDRMQHHLLSGSVHDDERETADRIQMELGKYRTFSDWHQGVDPNYDQTQAFDLTASPEDAAAALKNVATSSLYGDNGDVRSFIMQVEAHKDDAQWLQSYYAALGSDTTASLLNRAAQVPAGYGGQDFYGYPGSQETLDYYNESMSAIRTSLETLRQSGNLSQTDMNNLVNSLQEQGFDPNVAINIFGNASPQLQESFIRAAIANGDDTLDTAASHVLAQMPTSIQARILGSLSQTELNGFISGAMAGQTEITDLNNLLATGQYDQNVTFGGVETILQNAVGQTFQYYPYQSQPYSPELQRNIFNAVSQGLTNSRAFENFDNNVSFEDNLSRLFIRHRDQLLIDGQKGPNGENSGLFNTSFQDGLKKFFQLSLLTPPNGEQYEQLGGAVYQFINDGVTALSDPALANRDQQALDDFVARFGMYPNDYAQMLGSVLGSVMDATGFAQESINRDNAQKEATIKFFTGLAFAMIPSVGGNIASGIGNQIFKHFVERGTNYFQGQAQGNVQNQINSLLSRSFGGDGNWTSEVNSLVESIFNEGLRSLPNGDPANGSAASDQYNFQSFFYIGFDYASGFNRYDNATGSG